MATGEDHACIANADGLVKCWGANEAGQLGNDSWVDAHEPVTAFTFDAVRKVVAGRRHTCGLDYGGFIMCWGDNSSGALGDGSVNSSRVPTSVVTGLATPGPQFIDLAAGDRFTCGLKADGTVWCWGLNASGQLGNGKWTASTTPVRVDTSLIGPWVYATAITAGQFHVCLTVASGGMYCWGDNGYGQLGLGTSGPGTHQNRPTAPAMAYGNHGAVGPMAAGRNHTCGSLSDGTLACWGLNLDFELGIGFTPAYWEPTATPVSNFP